MDETINHVACENCSCPHSDVIDSRKVCVGGNETIRRRRKCRDCEHRWTTYELEESYMKALMGAET